MKNKILFGFILLFLASCANPIETTDLADKDNQDSDLDGLELEEVFPEEEVDLTKFNQVRSIRYTKGDFATSLEAYYDGEIPAVFIENYTISNGNYGERKYIFNNGKLSKVSDYHEIMNEDESKNQVTEIDYSYENDLLVKTSKKEGPNYEEFAMIEATIGKETPDIPHIQYLNDFLDKQGQFELHFLDIVDFGQNGYFLKAGEKDGKGLECFFKIAQPDDFLDELKGNTVQHYNKPINVDFEYRIEENGGEFMFYTSGSFK